MSEKHNKEQVNRVEVIESWLQGTSQVAVQDECETTLEGNRGVKVRAWIGKVWENK